MNSAYSSRVVESPSSYVTEGSDSDQAFSQWHGSRCRVLVCSWRRQ